MLKVKMNEEIKKVLTKVKSVQSELQTKLNQKAWIEDARRYAELQGKELQKMVGKYDLGKVQAFLEKEKKNLEKWQRQIPEEITKFRRFMMDQKKELETLLAKVATGAQTGTRKRTKKTGAKTKKTVSAKKKPAKSAVAPKTAESVQASTVE